MSLVPRPVAAQDPPGRFPPFPQVAQPYRRVGLRMLMHAPHAALYENTSARETLPRPDRTLLLLGGR